MDADLVREVAEEVKASSSTYVDHKIDVVDGSLKDTITAVLAVLERRGMLKDAA